jgi:hypothetical protein
MCNLTQKKTHGKFQVLILNGVEKIPLKTVTCICPIVKNPRALTPEP